jgi:hypothetical protein
MKIFASFYHYEQYLSARIASYPQNSETSFYKIQKWIEEDYGHLMQGLINDLAQNPSVEVCNWTIHNCKALQKAWAAENAPSIIDSPYWEEEILMEQLRRFRPDFYFAHGFPEKNNFIKRVRQEIPEIRLVATWDGRALNDIKRFEHVDLILSCSRNCVDFYRRNGFMAEYLPLFFDTRVVEHIQNEVKLNRAIFSGSIHIGRDGHNNRLRLLGNLTSLEELDFYLSITGLKNWRVWAGIIRRRDFDHLHSITKIALQNKRPLFGLDMFQLLAKYAVTLNCHIDAAYDFAGNIRLFESTGVGSCLLTDYKSNLNTLFDLDSEVITYNSIDECRDKMRWLLDNPKEASEIAKRGCQRTRKDHNSKVRAELLFSLIENKI